jgi:recombination protein RecA
MAKAKTGPKVTKLTPEAVMAAVNKHFGAGTISFADDEQWKVDRIPTGLLALDWRLNGGVARNRHTELSGANNVGKTAVSLRLMGNAQKLGLGVGYCDVEKTFDKVFARHLGVDTKTAGLVKHRSAESVVDTMVTMIQSGLYDVIVCDSIASLLPLAERDSGMDAASMGMEQAKLMSKALRKITTVNDKTAIIWINQLRENVGAGMFGKKTRTSGGMAMSFYAGLRIEFALIETIKRKSIVVDVKTGKDKKADVPKGHRALLKLTKEKTGNRPLSETTLVFDYDKVNFDPIEDVMYVGLVEGLITQNAESKWNVVGYEDVIKGRNAFKRWLKGNPEVVEELETEIRSTFGSGLDPFDEDDDEDDD